MFYIAIPSPQGGYIRLAGPFDSGREAAAYMPPVRARKALSALSLVRQGAEPRAAARAVRAYRKRRALGRLCVVWALVVGDIKIDYRMGEAAGPLRLKG